MPDGKAGQTEETQGQADVYLEGDERHPGWLTAQGPGWMLVAGGWHLIYVMQTRSQILPGDPYAYQLSKPSQRSHAINMLPRGGMGRKRHRVMEGGA